MDLRRLAVVLVTALMVGACSMLRPPPADDEAVPYPEGCPKYGLSERRCAAIVDELAERLHVDRGSVAGIELLGDPGCGEGLDPNVLCMRTTAFVVRVRFRLGDGRTTEDSLFCGVGGQHSILCTETPEIRLSSPMLDGYHDIPCAGEPPDGCATPVPTIDPAVAAEAVPLEIDALDIALDHVGRYQVDLGRASIANGVLRDASFTLADLQPTTFATTTDGVALRLTSLEPGGRPFWNSYEHGWRPGVERVSVTLEFEITSLEPGAVLEVRDAVVR